MIPLSTVVTRKRAARLLGAALLALCLGAAPAAGRCVTGSVLFENDLDGRGTDRHYTHGTRFSCISGALDAEDPLKRFAAGLEFDVLGLKFLEAASEVRYGFAFGQSMFTPEDLSRRDLIVDDRPYAGWLYGTAGLVIGPEGKKEKSSTGFDRLESIELTLGVVGPASQADDTQKFIHTSIDAPYPHGWHNQLRNEPGIVLSYEHKLRWDAAPALPWTGWLEADAMPSAGFALGNIHTYANAGITFRLGSNLASDFGPPRIRPSIAGSEYYAPDANEIANGYLFLSLGGRAVARNIFLDGNTFSDSHHVDKKVLVGDIQFGLVLSLFGKARVAVSHIIRSREFDGQDTHNQFSAISVTFPLP
jgi:lipid A 3-O-deacylase